MRGYKLERVKARIKAESVVVWIEKGDNENPPPVACCWGDAVGLTEEEEEEVVVWLVNTWAVGFTGFEGLIPPDEVDEDEGEAVAFPTNVELVTLPLFPLGAFQ